MDYDKYYFEQEPDYFKPREQKNYQPIYYPQQVEQKQPKVDDEKIFLYFIIILLVCAIVIIVNNFNHQYYELAKKTIKVI